MKRVVVVVLWMSLALNCGFISRYRERDGKPVFIHEDVGDDIDDIERQTYTLFPNIDGFVKAVLYEHPRGGYEWEIFTGEARLVARNEDPQTVLILGDFIERHDQIFESNLDFERTWDIVDYDVLGQPITRKEVERVIEQLKKRKGCGMVGSGMSCCLLGGLCGMLIGYSTRERPQYPDPDWWWQNLEDIPEVAIAIGAVAGAIGGFYVGALMIRSDAEQAMKIIKEARKPKVVK